MKISGLGAILNVAKAKKGSSVAIFGLGAVGLAVSFGKLLTIHTLLIAHIHLLGRIFNQVKILLGCHAEGARIHVASRIVGVDSNPAMFEEGTHDVCTLNSHLPWFNR